MARTGMFHEMATKNLVWSTSDAPEVDGRGAVYGVSRGAAVESESPACPRRPSSRSFGNGGECGTAAGREERLGARYQEFLGAACDVARGTYAMIYVGEGADVRRRWKGGYRRQPLMQVFDGLFL